MLHYDITPEAFVAIFAWMWLSGVVAGVGLAMMAKEFRD